MRTIAVVLVLAGCDAKESSTTIRRDMAPVDASVADAQPTPVCATTLELLPVDAWGRPLVAEIEGAPAAFEVDGPGQWTVSLGALDHQATEVELRWDGMAPSVTGTALWTASLDADEAGCPVHGVFLGLEHTWFDSAAGPWHADNRVELYVDPASLWTATSAAIRAARRSLFWSTWWWQSDTDLLRVPGKTPEQRVADTALAHVEAASGLERRILVNMFLAGAVEGAVNLTLDAPLRAHARDPSDGIEVMAHTNTAGVPIQEEYAGPEQTIDFDTRVRARPEWADRGFPELPLRQALEPTFEIGSFHMKGTIIDGQIAFVQGLNTQPDYWDTAEHAVFEPGRMDIDADADARQAVADRARLPDFVPFQDYGVRVEGPAVGEVEALYAGLWNHARAQLSVFHEDTTAWTPGDGGDPGGGIAVQFQATLPPPLTEQSILSGHRRAIANAREYILVEDQYWRATRLLDDFVRALQANPELVLIVVTNEIPFGDGGKKWTVHMHEALAAAAPERYLLMQRRVFDVQTSDEPADGRKALHDISIYNHSKLMLVDDMWLAVGSANKNNRSLLYDGEINAVIVDGPWVRAARDRILADWVGPRRVDRLGDDMGANLSVLRDIAANNTDLVAGWHARWAELTDADIRADASLRPSGTLFDYVPEGDFLLDVGPDLY